MRRKLPNYPIAEILEDFGAEMVPRVRGRSHRKMVCPFHDDTSPSASVSEFGFNCFACEVSGDAIKLLREQGGLSLAGAIERASELTGLTSGEVPRTSGWGGNLLD